MIGSMENLIARARRIANEGAMIHALDWAIIQKTLRECADEIEWMETEIETLGDRLANDPNS